MTKEILFKNLEECLEDVDRSLDRDEINFIVEVGYEEMKNWSYRNFRDFASDINNEWGDYLYVLREYDLLPDLNSEEELVKAWFADHKQAMQDCLDYFYIELDDSKTLDELFEENLGIEDILEWLKDHSQAYRDCISYVINQKK